ncbi:hypothetical protein J3E72DRAFT_383429 [Bipolaris maydis]|nr:hypothetical protein J3E72DRAFT_383429 [Bipolaris maydis]KAJ6274444.1 hypothetical protein PSV08DRAFT_358798 [Bipolaris maydis]
MKYLRENSSKRHYPNRYIGINKTRNRGRKGSYTALTNYMEVQRVYESYCTKNRKQPPELGLNESVWEKTKRSFPNRQKDIQKNYNLKIPCSYIGLRGGASSPDDDDSRNHRVRGNDNGSDQSSDGNDSLYRVDIQGGLSDEPADTSYEHTNGNAPDTENLENHMAQAGSLVNGSDEPHYNGAPATQGHMEDGASYGEFNGDFVASEDVGGHVLRNATIHRNYHVPPNATIPNGVNDHFSSRSARPPRSRMADDVLGPQVNGVSTAPPTSRRSSLSSQRTRVDSLRDAQQEEDDYVIDWWLCEPLGRTSSNATHSSSIASSLEREYFARHHQRRSSQTYDPLAGYYYYYDDDDDDDIQESTSSRSNSTGSALFPPPPNSMLSHVPYLDPGPASNIWPPNPGPPNLLASQSSRHASGTTVATGDRSPSPPSPSALVVVGNADAAAADSSTPSPPRSLTAAARSRRRRRRNAILARLRATWRGVVKRGATSSRFRRDRFK